MSKNPNTTAQQKKRMLAALKVTFGIVEHAAEQVGISRTTHYEWLKSDPKYKAKVEDLDEVNLDFGETMNYKLMQGYKLPDCKVFMVDVTRTYYEEGKKIVERTKEPRVVTFEKHFGPNQSAVEFFLSTKGKKRGYDNKINLNMKAVAKLKVVRVQQLPAGPGATLRIERPDKKK